MGKSKWGGTRGYLQGKIANDVYSIGKDGKGRKQQVVRSLAETVANPQTTAQMRGRMIMSTVMQAMKAMQVIVDHSFDGYPAGQPSLSQFISRNYELVKADVAAHPASGNKFGLVKYQEKALKYGQWLIADGRAQWPSGSFDKDYPHQVQFAVPLTNPKVGDLFDACGLGADDYVTVCGIKNGSFVYMRFRLKQNVDKTAALTAENVAGLFDTEGNGEAYILLESSSSKNYVTLALDNGSMVPIYTATCILTKKVGSTFRHSTAQMSVEGATVAYTADVALPTYPTGTEQFLNGGDI